LVGLLLDHEDRGEIFLRNVGWFFIGLHGFYLKKLELSINLVWLPKRRTLKYAALQRRENFSSNIIWGIKIRRR
jgi:hypothetical protein